MLSRPDGFTLYGNLGIEFFSTSELLYPNTKIRLPLIRTRPNFYMISDNPIFSVGSVNCSLYTRRIALKDDYHKKRMDMLVYTPVDFNYLETFAKTFIIPARQNQFIRENIFNNAPVRQIAIAMNTNSAFTRSYAENPFWYQQFDLRQIKRQRGGQPILDFDAADNCRLYVTTMKAMNFQDEIPSIPIDNFKDHYVVRFDLTSIQDATEICHYPEIVEEPLSLELSFTVPLEQDSELIVLGERMSSATVTSLVLLEKTSKMDNVSLQQIFNRSPLLKYRYCVSFPSDFVPTLDNDIFAIINTQPSKMQGEHWIMIANSRQKLYFADSLGRKKYSFLKQQYEQMMPEPLQSHPSVCGFYTIYAAFQLVKFRREEITGVHNVNVLPFISNHMFFSNFSNVNVQVIQCAC